MGVVGQEMVVAFAVVIAYVGPISIMVIAVCAFLDWKGR